MLRGPSDGETHVSKLAAGHAAPRVALDQQALTRGLREELGDAVWEHEGSELLVHGTRTRVALADGLVVVGLPVFTEQTGDAEVTIALAVGRHDAAAGAVVGTETAPRGPGPIVAVFGESLAAGVFRAVMHLCERAAAAAGVDETHEPLVVGALVADAKALHVTPLAAPKGKHL